MKCTHSVRVCMVFDYGKRISTLSNRFCVPSRVAQGSDEILTERSSANQVSWCPSCLAGRNVATLLDGERNHRRSDEKARFQVGVRAEHPRFS